jgi:hypothetical protein
VVVALAGGGAVIVAETTLGAVDVSNALEVAANWCFDNGESGAEEVEVVLGQLAVAVLDAFLFLALSIDAAT